MTIIYVTLQYADGSTWFAGQFVGTTLALAQAAANAWIAEEQSRPYWVNTTQILQTTTTAPVTNY